ncbi:MAG: hypothetical protein L0Y42_14055 [Phycisphaerales bacterium]|nr:hypothetical protein [Phycisphaerales bacterium]
MKNASVSAKKLGALLKSIGSVEPPTFPGMPAIDESLLPRPGSASTIAPPAPSSPTPENGASGAGPSHAPTLKPVEARPGIDPTAVLIMSMLLWESTTEKALAAYDRLMDHVVDFNDLRVCMPHETLDLIGPRYPRALDRCQRLRAMLRNIYLREHAVNLDRLIGSGKREAKRYVESLEGIVPYVAARVQLLCLGVHAIPVDDQLRIHLIEAEVIDAATEVPELSNWLGSQIKPADGAATHFCLQSWIDEIAARPADQKKSIRKPAPRKRPTRSGAKV